MHRQEASQIIVLLQGIQNLIQLQAEEPNHTVHRRELTLHQHQLTVHRQEVTVHQVRLLAAEEVEHLVLHQEGQDNFSISKIRYYQAS